MTDNVEECRGKFREVLATITPQRTISDDTFLEKIQSYLKVDEYAEIIKEAETIAWIERIIDAFESGEVITQQVANFTLKLLSLVCSNEWQFAAIIEKNLLEKIQAGIEKNAELQKPSIKLSHIQLLHAISQHSIGLHWLKQTRSWKLCINYYQTSNTIFIVRETGNFLFTVLTKFSELMKDDKLGEEIIDTILEPIINFRGKDQDEGRASTIVDDFERSREIMPSLNIANHLLTLCIESNKRSRMAYNILLKNRFENKIWQIVDMFETDTDILMAILRSLNTSNFARLSNMDIPANDPKATDLPFDVHTIHFFNIMMTCIIKRLFKGVNMIAEMHHILWNKLGSRAPKEVVLENQDLKYGDQVIMIQTLPIIYVIKSHYRGNHRTECINDICTKLFDKSCEHTIRLLYQYRDALAHETFEFVADLAANSIQKMVSLKKFLSRDRATLALQILIYALKGYVNDPMGAEENGTEKQECNIQLVLQAPSLLSTLLVGLDEMIKHYNFMWKECIESTTIASLLLVLLDNPNLSARQTVESVKLIQTSIEHFLAPNLALLVAKIEGSGMEHLGPMIYKRLHDNSWEVRDSVLELLYSIVEISNEKFPPFQMHLLENDICSIVEVIAKNDSEPYVRASAFKVLSSMVKINLLWENALYCLDVKKYAVEVLVGESEGVVRREAVALIASIYRHQQIPPQCLDMIFSVIAHCAVNDFYWEVKVNALNFWSTVICRQFNHQGMVDGAFPAVTFSKEHKKIITLTDKEIQLRLRKVLNELSLRGCLGIMMACLQDSDLEVVKKSVELVKKLLGYLNKYNFIEEYNSSKKGTTDNGVKPSWDSNYSIFFNNNLAGGFNPAVRNNADFSKTTEVTIAPEPEAVECCPDDMIIDSIVQEQDFVLLSNNYKKNLNITCTVELGEIDENLFKKYATVSADDFLNFITSTDLEKLIENKSEWLQHSENFSTLLDDVLRSFGHNVDLDCY